ncbi:MAG: 16S rRNA (guanine(527)-N(7))-methyltransferase RsmG [Bacteroidota bacterium]
MKNHEIIGHYFPGLTDRQTEQFRLLQDLYATWNERINVISRKDMDNLYINHVLHSLGIATVLRFLPDTTILDVGTGGGFPGIPLAILFPEARFHLVDSIGKKITVVNEVVKGTGLQNVTTEVTRAEKVNGKFEFIVSRAVTRMKEFHGWVHQKIDPINRHALANGILYLKGGDLEEEMNELKRPWTSRDLKDKFSEEFFETKKVIYMPLA